MKIPFNVEFAAVFANASALLFITLLMSVLLECPLTCSKVDGR